jgi:hypothetical protein
MDLELTGFDFSEIDELLARANGTGLTDEEAVPDLPETPVSKLGNLWVLGKHRLLCGDAMLLSNYDLVLAGDVAAITFTDPPTRLTMKVKQTKAKDRKRRSG